MLNIKIIHSSRPSTAESISTPRDHRAGPQTPGWSEALQRVFNALDGEVELRPSMNRILNDKVLAKVTRNL